MRYQLLQHPHERHVDESASSEGDDPRDAGGVRGVRATAEIPETAPSECTDGSDQLCHDGLSDCEPRLYEDGEITNLVGDLVDQNSEGSTETDIDADEVGGREGHAVSEVVSEVAQKIQDASDAILGGSCAGGGGGGGRSGDGFERRW